MTISRPVVTLRNAIVLLLILGFPFVFVAGMDSRVAQRENDISVWQVHQARVLRSEVSRSSQLPASGWESVVLPNRQSGEGDSLFSVWYRFEVDVPTDLDDSWAMYLPSPNANYAVSVNGHFAATTGPMEPPVPRYLVPVILRLPGALFHTGKNVVDLHAVCEIPVIRLRTAYLGPARILAPVHSAARFWAVTVKQVTVICMLVVCLAMAALYALRRPDAAFGWYALALMCWAIHISVKLIAHAPFPATLLWANVSRIALGTYVICAACFVDRFVGANNIRLQRWYLYWGLFGALVLVVDPLVFGYRQPWFYNRLWLPPIVVLGIYQTWQLIRAAYDPANIEARMLAIVAWWALVAGFGDGLTSFGVLKLRTEYLTFFVGPLLLVLGFVLLRRFVRAADVVERARDELAVRVAEKTAALERNLVNLKGMEQERALSAERERIMRDMHDGVGGQLVQALSIATTRPELQPMEEPLRACLEELRLIIDSIEPSEGDLASVLGMLRARMVRRLTAAGVNIHWQVEDTPRLTDFGPQRVLQVTRIVHEAIESAFRRRQARNITVRAHALPKRGADGFAAAVAIEISDDGLAETEAGSVAVALIGMHRRAHDVGGKLSVVSSSTSFTLHLELPLSLAPSKDDSIAQSPEQVLPLAQRSA